MSNSELKKLTEKNKEDINIGHNKEQKHIRKLAKKFTELKTLKQRAQFIEDNPLIPKKKSNSLWLLYVAGLLICFLFLVKLVGMWALLAPLGFLMWLYFN
jgi:hypothetical protein